MSSETPETPVASTPPTPENVAEMLTSGDNDYHDGNYWHPSIGSVGNVVHIGITAYSEDGDKLPEVHFRAVVVEGETAPILLERPEITNPEAMHGPRFGEETGESMENGWSVFATNHVLFGGSGHISPAETRRFAAALVATADALEAAQAEERTR
ncbi:hypothetical protein ABGB18_11285 [Nonomuraea sp. B12E4]|uniref:hypothetical protein n=1 Tax=Nonomuraea sp. B12E4 TaxID=3153564 RepID=UPI00325F8CB1